MDTRITPKNITQMKLLINAQSVSDLSLAPRLAELVGFDVRWSKLDIVQAAMVWLAWNALNGDAQADEILTMFRGLENGGRSTAEGNDK